MLLDTPCYPGESIIPGDGLRRTLLVHSHCLLLTSVRPESGWLSSAGGPVLKREEYDIAMKDEFARLVENNFAREEGYAEGVEKGIKEGLEKGREEGFRLMTEMLRRKGMAEEAIEKLLEEARAL